MHIITLHKVNVHIHVSSSVCVYTCVAVRLGENYLSL